MSMGKVLVKTVAYNALRPYKGCQLVALIITLPLLLLLLVIILVEELERNLTDFPSTNVATEAKRVRIVRTLVCHSPREVPANNR